VLLLLATADALSETLALDESEAVGDTDMTFEADKHADTDGWPVAVWDALTECHSDTDVVGETVTELEPQREREGAAETDPDNDELEEDDSVGEDVVEGLVAVDADSLAL